MENPTLSLWEIAEQAAIVSAVAPTATAGIVVNGFAGPVRDEWLRRYRAMLGDEILGRETQLRRIPVTISPDRLTAGLDLAATLRDNRLVLQRGVLAQSDGGVILLSMAERTPEFTSATIAAALDNQQIEVHRDGVSKIYPSAIGVIAFDEGVTPQESVAFALKDRLAMWIDLREISIHQVENPSFNRQQIDYARQQWPQVKSSHENQKNLCLVAASLGVDSIRALIMTDRVSRIIAVLDERNEVGMAHLTQAVQLVLVPRATQIPQTEHESEQVIDEEQSQQSADKVQQDRDDGQSESETAEPDSAESQVGNQFDDLVLQSVVANLPTDLMSRLPTSNKRERNAKVGRSGDITRSRNRGRPVGNEPGLPSSGRRLDLLASLRAAAPWQLLRRTETQAFSEISAPTLKTKKMNKVKPIAKAQLTIKESKVSQENRTIIVKAQDLRVKRFLQCAETTTIFVVDASGSAALHRLAEAKGAVESMLAECYSRRDRVALIAFRGSSAELLLPPTRSLVRAKKEIIAMPGGGGTPIATAIDRAKLLAEQVQHEGSTAAVVLFTDGKANIARDGTPGRELAMQEAIESSTKFAASGFRAIVVDTSPRPSDNARLIATKLGGHYLPLPVVDAKKLSGVIQDVLH